MTVSSKSIRIGTGQSGHRQYLTKSLKLATHVYVMAKTPDTNWRTCKLILSPQQPCATTTNTIRFWHYACTCATIRYRNYARTPHTFLYQSGCLCTHTHLKKIIKKKAGERGIKILLLLILQRKTTFFKDQYFGRHVPSYGP